MRFHVFVVTAGCIFSVGCCMLQIRRLENEKKMLERKLHVERGKSHDKMESVDLLQSNLAFGASSSFNVSYLEHENKDLKQKCNQLEALLAEKEAELARLRARDFSRCIFMIKIFYCYCFTEKV